ncbi:MAG: iron ABC transporter permease, partial [Burkholderiaceae bacterium]
MPADWPARAMLAIAGLLIAPLGTLLVMALIGFDSATLAHLARTVLVDSMVVSAVLTMGAVFGAAALGVGCAWAIERHRFAGRALIAWLLVLPLAMPTYVIAYAYTDLLQYSGPLQRWLRSSWGFGGRLPDVRSLPAAIVLFAFVLYPYVYLITRTALRDVSRSTIDSARLLGLSRRRVFRRVVLPIVAPAIVAGSMLVMMETLADVGATHYFGLQTFSAGIYRAWYALGDRGAALMLAVVLLAAVAVIFVVEHRARHRVERTTSRTHRPWPPDPVVGFRGWLLAAVLLLPVVIGFVIPTAALLLLLAAEPELTTRLSRFWRWTGNSLMAGVAGATVVLAVSIGFVYARRFGGRYRARWLDVATNGLRFGYAVPGAVIALAILWPVANAERFVSDAIGLPSRLLTDSLFALVYAYALRFFAVAHGGLEAAMLRVTPSLDHAARSLGASRLAAFRRVHLPLIARAALVAWMLVLIDVMKELPATLMLRPFNFDTLAVIAQQLAQDERLAEAALPALAIVAVGIGPVLLVSSLMTAGAPTAEAPLA